MARRRRWVLLVFLTLMAAAGLAVWRVYLRPPLHMDGAARFEQGTLRVLGLDLANNGRWPVRLTAVTVEAEGSGYQVEALVSLSGELAGSAAWRSLVWEDGDPPTPITGPVAGWEIEPTRWGERRPMHGLRVVWEEPDPWPRRIVIHYRYLGLPMELAVPEHWWN